MELKRFLPEGSYKNVKKHFAGKNWEIVGFTDKHLVLRIEDENVEFERSTGRVSERVSLKGPRRTR